MPAVPIKNYLCRLSIICAGRLLCAKPVPPFIGLAINRARVAAEPNAPHAVMPSFARYALEDVSVDDVLDTGRPLPRSSLSFVRDFTEHWLTPEQHDYVVVGEDGEFAGILSLHRLRRTPRDRWEAVPIQALLHRKSPHAVPREPIDDVLERMADHAVTAVPVLDPETGKLLGEITSGDVFSLILDEGTH